MPYRHAGLAKRVQGVVGAVDVQVRRRRGADRRLVDRVVRRRRDVVARAERQTLVVGERPGVAMLIGRALPALKPQVSHNTGFQAPISSQSA